jgi:catechol 2,3-dioxygenase-like lactoylglutathione lyase family enzyme
MTRIHHTGLTVSDLDRSLRFWRDALGMEVVMRQEKEGGYLARVVSEPEAHVRMAHLVFPGTEGPRVELFQYLAPDAAAHRLRPPEVGFAHICLACEGIEELLEALTAAGGSAYSDVADVDTGANAGSRCVYVRDPDGHTIELFELPPRREEATS